MSDLTTSLKEIFNERISSPFYGSLIVSWLLWNWKIPYVTFFVDQSRLGDATNKIDYILKFCSNPWQLILFPLLSTALILFILPYATNYAFYITAKFDRWRKDKQIEIDRSQVLTVEQSLKILSDAQKQEENFKNLLTSRDEQIKLLNQQLETALKSKPKGNSSPTRSNKDKDKDKDKGKGKDEDYTSDLNIFFNNSVVQANFSTIVKYIQQDWAFDRLPAEATQFCESFNLIEPVGNSRFKLTEKGKFFLREFIKKNPNQNLYDKQSQIIK